MRTAIAVLRLIELVISDLAPMFLLSALCDALGGEQMTERALRKWAMSMLGRIKSYVTFTLEEDRS